MPADLNPGDRTGREGYPRQAQLTSPKWFLALSAFLVSIGLGVIYLGARTLAETPAPSVFVAVFGGFLILLGAGMWSRRMPERVGFAIMTASMVIVALGLLAIELSEGQFPILAIVIGIVGVLSMSLLVREHAPRT